MPGKNFLIPSKVLRILKPNARRSANGSSVYSNARQESRVPGACCREPSTRTASRVKEVSRVITTSVVCRLRWSLPKSSSRSAISTKMRYGKWQEHSACQKRSSTVCLFRVRDLLCVYWGKSPATRSQLYGKQTQLYKTNLLKGTAHGSVLLHFSVLEQV